MKLFYVIFLFASLYAGVTVAPADATAPAPNARERQNTPLWINVPVPPAALASVIPAPLVADIYEGNAYINILTYSLDKLEFYTWFGFVDTFTKGWVTKITVFVYDPVHKKHGYLITSIDFQNNLSGWIRSAGAMLQQKIPSHVCSFNSDYNTANQQISFDFKCDNDGFKGSSAYTKGAGSGVDNAFVNWVALRNTKFLKQNDGTVVYADVTYPGIEAGLKDWYPLQGSSTWTTNIFSSRLGLSDNYPICQQPGQCFWASYYGIIDHVNTPINAANTASVAVALDGTFVDTTSTDPAMISTSSMSNNNNNNNNMIWLYGILIGFGSAVLIGSMIFAVMRYHSRGKQIVHSVQQHVETNSN